jgi:hypothetical protein
MTAVGTNEDIFNGFSDIHLLKWTDGHHLFISLKI